MFPTVDCFEKANLIWYLIIRSDWRRSDLNFGQDMSEILGKVAAFFLVIFLQTAVFLFQTPLTFRAKTFMSAGVCSANVHLSWCIELCGITSFFCAASG